MDEKRSAADKLGGLEGTDAAAIGVDATPESAPPGATIDDDVKLVPGEPPADDRHEAKPWFTSLAARSDQAGVANDPPDAQEPQFPPEDDRGA